MSSGSSVPEVVNVRCCGLDVHKETVVACVRVSRDGGRADHAVRTFATTTKGLLELGDWLAERRVTVAAMESTGVHWKPVWNLLEGRANADGRPVALMLVPVRLRSGSPGTSRTCPGGRPTCGTASGSPSSRRPGCSRPASCPTGRGGSCGTRRGSGPS